MCRWRIQLGCSPNDSIFAMLAQSIPFGEGDKWAWRIAIIILHTYTSPILSTHSQFPIQPQPPTSNRKRGGKKKLTSLQELMNTFFCFLFHCISLRKNSYLWCLGAVRSWYYLILLFPYFWQKFKENWIKFLKAGIFYPP